MAQYRAFAHQWYGTPYEEMYRSLILEALLKTSSSYYGDRRLDADQRRGLLLLANKLGSVIDRMENLKDPLEGYIVFLHFLNEISNAQRETNIRYVLS